MKKCYALYNENPEFQKECDQCTGWVLNGHAVKDFDLANENIADFEKLLVLKIS